MRRFIVFLVLALLAVGTRIEAQWSDTTFVNEANNEVLVAMDISNDSLFVPTKGWAHPSIVLMCSPTFPQLLSVIWVGGEPAPGVVMNAPAFVRVAFQLDSGRVALGVWQANNEKHIIFPELPHMTAFMKLMLDADKLHFAYALSDGSFAKFTFDLTGVTQEWAKVSKKCPLVVLPTVSDSSTKS